MPFNIGTQEVYTCHLDHTQRESAYNTTTGVSNRSIRITSDEPVSVYALTKGSHTDATNVLPVTALNTEYYQISYSITPVIDHLDAYDVIATQNNTRVYHDGILETTLATGEVYYRTSTTDMTGVCITADYPVAFFALHQLSSIPAGMASASCLMQQLAPVNTWGKNFFVPVSHFTLDIVRIVASQNDTDITQTGGIMLYPLGGQTSLTGLQAGEFVELVVNIDSAGCFIQSNKPVGVCTYLTSHFFNGGYSSTSAQCWLPAIGQSVSGALIAPFVPSGLTLLYYHNALITTPTATKENTKVSIEGGPLTALSSGACKTTRLRVCHSIPCL
jgi:hypothetical protein